VSRRQKSEYRRAVEFAVLLAGLSMVFAVVSLVRHHGTRAAMLAGAGLSVLAFATLARPIWLAIFRLWMKLAEAMGWVMTRLVLSVFYFLVLTPVGWARSWTGKPTLDTAWRDGKSSYWVEKEPVEPTVERYMKRY